MYGDYWNFGDHADMSLSVFLYLSAVKAFPISTWEFFSKMLRQKEKKQKNFTVGQNKLSLTYVKTCELLIGSVGIEVSIRSVWSSMQYAFEEEVWTRVVCFQFELPYLEVERFRVFIEQKRVKSNTYAFVRKIRIEHESYGWWTWKASTSANGVETGIIDDKRAQQN